MKNLIVFDFDQTIVNTDTDYELFKLLPEPLYTQFINTDYYSENYTWTEHMNKFYKLLKQQGYDIKKKKKCLNTFELAPKFKELFNYLQLNKNQFEIYILSSACDFSIEYLLNKFNIKNLFDGLLCNKVKEDEENMLILKQSAIDENCELCYPNQCKYKLFYDSFNEKINTYNNIIYVCDGGNDFCIARKLNAKDYLMIRKNYRLDKILNKHNSEVQCKKYKWENGEDIINILKTLN